MTSAEERARLNLVSDALEILRSGKPHSRSELFPNSDKELNSFQRKVLGNLVELGVIARQESGDPNSPTVRYLLRNRKELENLLSSETALSRVIWPSAIQVADKPPMPVDPTKVEKPTHLQIVPPIPEPVVGAPEVPMPPTADLQQLFKLIEATGGSIIYIRDRLDELCKFIAADIPDRDKRMEKMEKELEEMHKILESYK